MDLRFTKEQEAYRLQARDWIAENLAKHRSGGQGLADDDAAAARYNRDWERLLHAGGYAGVAWPVAYGGQGLSIVEHLIVSEELGRAGAPEGLNIVGTELTGPMLLKAGTEEQRRRFLPRILSADEIWCQGFSEPGAGSDLASLRAIARRDGDGWVITGQKVWTSNAYFSDWCLFLARTNPEVPKHHGLTIFLVPMNSPGIDVRPLRQISGRSEFNEIFLDEVRVPASNIVGDADQGWRIATQVLSIERGTNRLYRQSRFMFELQQLVLQSAGAVDGLDEKLADEWFRQRLAGIYCELAIFRFHNLKLVSRVAAEDQIGAETSFLKLFWSQAHQALSSLAIDMLGDEALSQGQDSIAQGYFQDLYLQTRAETIHAGTVQIQKNIIAERLLGLPR
jgi:alkylation response protein AidB-like acyl-CoA dehydrogenase